jgi:Ser/Thr protein kinase RdoA (MazF antagonist)
MDVPILKLHWERFKAHVELDKPTAAALLAPYSQDPIDELTLLSEGCANTNYKVRFKNHAAPVVIRIYVREKDALSREHGLQQLIAGKIPAPRFLYTDNRCQAYAYPYAIMEWMNGILLREAILGSKDEKIISECAQDAGIYLGELRRLRLPQGGFFQEDLSIRPYSPEEEFLPYVLNLLNDKIVQASLGTELHQATTQLVQAQAGMLPPENEANLTHADYDPANMLVQETPDGWKISAILDWEFAFAGTYLLDIGMMLRYAHKLPACYEKSFISGLERDSGPLPAQWKKQAKLMDLLCLLQLAHYNPQQDRPKLNRDVVSLIANTVKHWDQF